MLLSYIFQNYETLLDTEISVNGWVKTCRDHKQMIFIHISDGSTQKTLQIIASLDHLTTIAGLSQITTGTSIFVRGILIKSPAKDQNFELSAREVQIYQICDQAFPLQKVGLSLEFMRNFPHLRHRSNIMRAVFVIKSCIMKSIHDFFTDKSYCQVDLPILTSNACESGCQPLQVTNLLTDGKILDIPVIMVKKETRVTSRAMKCIVGADTYMADTPTEEIDFTKDFFDKPVYLTVSNQLHLECFAHGLGNVYTITQATRGEPSQTSKHLATFNMLEWESCFGTLNDNINIAESLIKYCANQILKKCVDEIAILDKNEKGTTDKIKKIANEPFHRISHLDAIKLLKTHHLEIPFVDEPKYNNDLSTEHERWLVNYFGKPVAVMRYPKAVKAFYMPVYETIDVNESENINSQIEYVDCYDLLMDIGEVVGGSQRIWNEQELISRMKESGVNPSHLDWYVNLRKYGSVPHGGAGIGIERLTAALTGMHNIKDCISFPITIHSCPY